MQSAVQQVTMQSGVQQVTMHVLYNNTGVSNFDLPNYILCLLFITISTNVSTYTDELHPSNGGGREHRGPGTGKPARTTSCSSSLPAAGAAH